MGESVSHQNPKISISVFLQKNTPFFTHTHTHTNIISAVQGFLVFDFFGTCYQQFCSKLHLHTQGHKMHNKIFQYLSKKSIFFNVP